MKRTGKRELGAVIAGDDSRVDIETFGSAKIEWFETFIELPNGIPSHDTFGRVFSLIGARRFQDLSADRASGRSSIHMALGQVKTDDHSSEITAIPEPLNTLEVKG